MIEENKKIEQIEIKPVGSYFELDSEGYIVNPTSAEKIQEEWKPLLDDVVALYKAQYGDTLKSVYVRGSVAKGQAVQGVSDVDTLAYIDSSLPKHEVDRDWIESAEAELLKKYPFAQKVEMETIPFSDIHKDYIILNQSLLLYGTASEIPKLKPGKELMIHAPRLEKRMKWFEEKLQNLDSPEELEKGCVWFMKNTLRAGFELTMERSKRYTRDLYLCYKDFAEYYPDKEPQMREVLHYALNPTNDKKKLKEIFDGIIPWMLEESKYII